MSLNPSEHPTHKSVVPRVTPDEQPLAVAVEEEELTATPILVMEADEPAIPVAIAMNSLRPEPPVLTAIADEAVNPPPARVLVADNLVKQASPAPEIRAQPRRTKRRFGLSLHVIVMLFAAMILGQFALMSYVKFASRGERLQRLEELAASTAPAGSDLDVTVLLDFLKAPEQRDQAAQTLSRLQGGSFIDDMVLAYLDEVRTLPACAKLVEVIGERRIMRAFQPVLALVKDYRQEVQKQAWTALSKITTAETLPTLLDAVQGDSVVDLNHIVRSLVSLVERTDDRAAASSLVERAYEATTTNVERREILLKVLFKTGGEESLPIVSAAVADPATAVRQTAIYAVAQYPTHDLLPVLTARLPEETDPTCREYLILAAIELIPRPGPYSQNTLARHAQSLYANAKTVEERQTALRAVSAVIAPETAVFYQEFAEKGDPALRTEALEMSTAFQSKLSKVTLVPAGPGGGATPLPATLASSALGGNVRLENDVLVNWMQETDEVAWLVQFPTNGDYEINVYQSHDQNELGTYEILLAGKTVLTAVVKTGGVNDFKGFVAGKVSIPEPGIFRLILRPRRVPTGSGLFHLQKLTIKAVGGAL